LNIGLIEKEFKDYLISIVMQARYEGAIERMNDKKIIGLKSAKTNRY
jgi:hypothetical protein